MVFKPYTKTCKVCLRELPLSQFPINKDARKKRGFTIKSDCYGCHAKKNLKDYYDNHEQRLAHDRAYRKKHRLQRKRYARQYRRQFISPRYSVKDMQPKIDYTIPSPSPDEWTATAELSQARIIVRYS